MKAAVVSSFDTAPCYEEFPAPAAAGDDDMVIDVIAAGLHPRVRSQADGSHYTSTGELPLVPGIDGVGRGADGLLRYFILPDTTMGAMAEQTVIDTRRSIVLPDDSDPIAVAAAMNPAMSSWVALRRRVQFRAGHNVLVLGATGNAGQMAVQVANLFGADQVIAAGRGADRLAGLPALGATGTVLLQGDADTVAQRLGRAATDRQRARLRQHPRNPRRTARTRPGDHERGPRHRRAAHPTHRRRTSPDRRRPYDTAHRSHATALDAPRGCRTREASLPGSVCAGKRDLACRLGGGRAVMGHGRAAGCRVVRTATAAP